MSAGVGKGRMSVDEASRLVSHTLRTAEGDGLPHGEVEERMHALEDRIAAEFQDDPELVTEFRRAIASNLFRAAIRGYWPLDVIRRLLTERDVLGYEHISDKCAKYFMFALVCEDEGRNDLAVESLRAIREELVLTDPKDAFVRRDLWVVKKRLRKFEETAGPPT
jgi:hypothetical protein